MKLDKNIKALIFDFGNVIINIDFERTNQAFKDLLKDDYEKVMQYWDASGLHERMESETMSAQEITAEINEHCDTTITDEQFKTAWNALLLNLPDERLKLIEQLKEHYSLYLLSNTNQVHIQKIFSTLEDTYGENPMPKLFKHLFLSYQMGCIKPQHAIYEQVLENIPFNAEECLFFDDLPENIEGAAELGIKTQLVTKEMGILELFADNGFTVK